jgi:hypothetical protein
MTRILQVRRGTTAQNDSFTGLSGEITFDTTLKTLRVHDGETLGGFALARKDELSDFDINSVSSAFWTTLFSTYQTNTNIQSESSNLQSITNTVFIDYEFVLGQMPAFSNIVLVCQNPDAGYSIDDEVCAFGIGDYGYPRANIYVSNNHLHARLYLNNQTIWVFHKTNGTKTNIDNTKWKIKFTVYY